MHTLPKLAYEYDALAPHISQEIMQLHHQKHHQTYVDKLNAALEDVSGELKSASIAELLGRLDELPDALRQAVRNNGGGHYNHSLFWQVLTPNGTPAPEGDLLTGIEKKYGSFMAFKEEFTAKATGLFGSGWVWLQDDLSLIASPNQDNPLMDGGVEPLMGLDVWEHAYYLDYKNVRADYIDAWWNIIDWQFVASRYQSTR